MKKMKSLLFAVIFASTMLYTPQAEARVYESLYLFPNGCIGIHYHHTILWGTFQWDTYEVVACP